LLFSIFSNINFLSRSLFSLCLVIGIAPFNNYEILPKNFESNFEKMLESKNPLSIKTLHLKMHKKGHTSHIET
jgi:hypothetical protein